jgi:hypothetical protein
MLRGRGIDAHAANRIDGGRTGGFLCMVGFAAAAGLRLGAMMMSGVSRAHTMGVRAYTMGVIVSCLRHQKLSGILI